MAEETGAWMPIYWADYLGDTTHLTTEQHGAYLLLIGTYWRRGGPLPADDDFLRQVTKSGKRWGHIRKQVLEFFVAEPVSDDRNRELDNRLTVTTEKIVLGHQLKHKRLEKEILRSSIRLSSARAAGKAGGLAKRKLVTVIEEEVRKKKENNKSRSAAPVAHPNLSDQKTQLYARGKEVLGEKAGGLIKNLLAAMDESVPKARAAIEQASTKTNAREYIGGVMRGQQSDDDLAKERRRNEATGLSL